LIRQIQPPPPVKPGDRVGIAALSGPVDPAALDTGLGELRRIGFEPVTATNLKSREGLFAGSDQERLEGFHRLVADESLSAVFFARGGHGLLRLLPRIDWDLLARRPRAYIGYSDVTPFLNQVVMRLGWVAFHGPMVAVDFARGLQAVEEVSLLGALVGEPQVIPSEGGSGEVVEGTILGGCLSLLTAVLETKYAVDLEDAVLFWEDVDEPVYRLDRMLTHLDLSGRLSAIKAMVVGCVEPADEHEAGETLRQRLDLLALEKGLSLAVGIPSGHCCPNLTLPIGAIARVDPPRGEVTFSLGKGVGAWA